MFKAAILVLSLAGCASPIVQTKVVEKPITVPCEVPIPGECKDQYAVNRLLPGADPLIVNRALRAEIEERTACEIKLKAAIKGCNQE